MCRRLEAGLAGFDLAKRSFPALLQLRCDKPVVRVASGVAALGQRRLIAGLLQVQLQDVSPLVHPLHAQSLRCRGGLDRDRLDRAQKLTSKNRIDTRTAKGQATRGAEHKVWIVAAIGAARASIIGDLEATATSGAAKQTDEERLAAATGLDLADTAVGVRRELLLVPFELGPV